MKFYYIDDNMLSNSEFANQILHRFRSYIEKYPADLILVSAAHKESPQLMHFIESMEDTMVLASPCQFDYQGTRGNLRDTYLQLEGFKDMHSYSGSFVVYDTSTKHCERMYLELFLP